MIRTINEKILNRAGVILSLQGKAAQAIEVYKKTLEINSSYSYAHFNLATECLKSRFPEQAIYEYEKYLEYNPNTEDREKILDKIYRLKEKI